MSGEVTKYDRLLAERLKRRTCGKLPDDEGAECTKCDDKTECDYQWQDAAQIIADDMAEERRVHAAVVASLEAMLIRRGS